MIRINPTWFMILQTCGLPQSISYFLAAIKAFRIFSHDVNHAYFQNKDNMSRSIFILPKREDLEIIGITDEEILELLRPLYVTCDVGDYWGVTAHFHVEEDLGMKQTVGDPALYLKISDGELEGVVGIYVDDNIHVGNRNFEETNEESLKRFDSKPRVYDNFDFFGTVNKKTKRGEFAVTQERHDRRISKAARDCTFQEFRKLRASLSWLANTPPELCCLINRAAQVTRETFSKEKIKEFNKAVKIANRRAVSGLTSSALESSSLRFNMYADAAFASNDDLLSQLGHIAI